MATGVILQEEFKLECPFCMRVYSDKYEKEYEKHIKEHKDKENES